MKYILSPSLVSIANRASKIPYVKAILKPFYYSYKKYLNRKRNQVFNKYGQSVLEEFDKVLVDNGFNYSIFAGTLLGAIREGAFLKHDVDIDTMLFYSEYSPQLPKLLKSAGFKLIHRFAIDGGTKGMEETYEKNNVSIDIFYIYADNDYPTYQCDFHAINGAENWERSMQKFGYVGARRIEFPVSNTMHRISISNIQVNAIDNAEEWLSCRYGLDYMIPNPNFIDKGDNPKMWDWTTEKAIYLKF